MNAKVHPPELLEVGLAITWVIGRRGRLLSGSSAVRNAMRWMAQPEDYSGASWLPMGGAPLNEESMTEIEKAIEDLVETMLTKAIDITKGSGVSSPSRLDVLRSISNYSMTMEAEERTVQAKLVTDQLSKLKADTAAAEARLAAIAGTVQPKRKTRSDAGKPRTKKEQA